MERRDGCCCHVLGGNSARPFRHPAPIFRREKVRDLLRANRSTGSLVEIGAGNLRNARFLQKRGLTVTVVELASVRARFEGAYKRFEQAGGYFVECSTSPRRRLADGRWPGGPFDFAVATFVIETVCDPKVRLAILRRCLAELKGNGILLIAVRGIADVVTAHATGVRCSDGYVTPGRTFIRSYTREQLDATLRDAGFSSVEFLHRHDTARPEYLYAMARA
jgi:Methyltransferase domain